MRTFIQFLTEGLDWDSVWAKHGEKFIDRAHEYDSVQIFPERDAPEETRNNSNWYSGRFERNVFENLFNPSLRLASRDSTNRRLEKLRQAYVENPQHFVVSPNYNDRSHMGVLLRDYRRNANSGNLQPWHTENVKNKLESVFSGENSGLQIDPKYQSQMVRMYLSGEYPKIEDVETYGAETWNKYQQLARAGMLRDDLTFNNFERTENGNGYQASPISHKHTKYKKITSQQGLENIVHHPAYDGFNFSNMPPAKEGVDYKKVYEDDEAIVHVPLTHLGMIYLSYDRSGKKSPWCVGADSPSGKTHFEETYPGALFKITPKHPMYPGEQYLAHWGQREVTNERNVGTNALADNHHTGNGYRFSRITFDKQGFHEHPVWPEDFDIAHETHKDALERPESYAKYRNLLGSSLHFKLFLSSQSDKEKVKRAKQFFNIS